MRRIYQKARYRASKEIYYSFGAFLFSAPSHGNLWEKYEATLLKAMRKQSNRSRNDASKKCP